MPQHELLACAQCGCFAFSCFKDFAIRVSFWSWFVRLPIGMEFSLMPTDMVRKPQDKPVMEYRDMKVGA